MYKKFIFINKELYKLLIKFSNHISFENFNYILELFGGKSWIDNFDEEELEKIRENQKNEETREYSEERVILTRSKKIGSLYSTDI